MRPGGLIMLSVEINCCEMIIDVYKKQQRHGSRVELINVYLFKEKSQTDSGQQKLLVKRLGLLDNRCPIDITQVDLSDSLLATQP